MRLVVNEPGLFVGTRGGMITVYKKREKALEVSTPKVDLVVILTRGASFSSALIGLLLKHNIPLIFYSSYGVPLAICKGFTSGAIKLRKCQYKAQESKVGEKLAKAFATGKILNQYSLLYSMAKNRASSDPQLAKGLYEKAREIRSEGDKISKLGEETANSMRRTIMNIEAEAAQIYWEGVTKALSKVISFPGRKKRFENPSDPVNIALNYLYTILAGECWMHVEASGLDPFSGFLHSDSPRRPALVMDLVEEFRQPVVDRVVFKALFERRLDNVIEGNRLKREARLMLYKLYAERLAKKVTFSNRCLPLQDHILLQARRIGEHVMEREEYKPFTE
jgi:CRISPR-associated protein Cas1